MESQNINDMKASTTPPTQVKSHRTHAVHWLLVGLAAILFGVGLYGVYYWQHSRVNGLDHQVAHLQTQLTDTTAAYRGFQKQVAASQSGTFTYTPHTAGLSLTLPKSYALLVAADGNAGGAPGVMFRVVPSSDSHISDDWGYYTEARVEASPTFTTLNQEVKAVEQQTMDYVSCRPENGTCDISDFSASDTTIAGLPAKLIKANGINEYLGWLNVYVVGLGQWRYTITINEIPNASAPADLSAAILKGISIKQAAY